MNRPPVDLQLSLERAAIEAGKKRELHLVARIDGVRDEQAERHRPRLSVIFVIDVSGSMQGPPLEHVIHAMEKLIELLDAEDRVGIVAFSDSATEIASLKTLDAPVRRQLKRRVRKLSAGGSTHIEAGLRLAQSMLPEREQHERQMLLLLTDGAPNRGVSNVEGLSDIVAAMRPQISLSTLGFGAHHNEDLLYGMADAGAGDYAFIADPAECDYEFARALGSQDQIVAEGLELILCPEDGVEIAEVLSHKRTRFSKQGLVVQTADLMQDKPIFVIARLVLEPPREPQSWSPIEVRLGYALVGRAERRKLHITASLPVKHTEGPLVESAYHRVLLARAENARAEARALADRGQYDSAAAVIRKMIAEMEAAPGYVAADGSDLSEALEQLVDEANVYELKPSAEDYRSFRKVQLGMEMQHGGMHVSDRSNTLTVAMSGALRPALLEAISGPLSGQIFPLDRPDMLLGRSPGNHIVIPSAQLSKRHVRIVARDGDFHIVDLGSTNATFVNGNRISEPVQLKTGDEIRLGDNTLRFRMI